MTKTYIDELVEEIATLRNYYNKAITREREMATKFNNAYWENLQLKALLKECREFLIVYLEDGEIAINNVCASQMIDKIDEELKKK